MSKKEKRGFFSSLFGSKTTTEIDPIKEELTSDADVEHQEISESIDEKIDSNQVQIKDEQLLDPTAIEEPLLELTEITEVTTTENIEPEKTIDINLNHKEEESLDLIAIEEEQTKTNPIKQQNEPLESKGFFGRLVQGLVKTKQNLGSGIASLFLGKKIDDELFEELEETLFVADIGIDTTNKIIKNLNEHVNRKQLQDSQLLYQQLKQEMYSILKPIEIPLDTTQAKPFVILVVGVNGAGKTTTIGKLAQKFKQQGKSVMLAAGDTFRAAAVEQLHVWGERNDIAVVAQHTGADSASVIYDAIQSAKTKNYDILIADTAGRLQNKENLMNELKKIVKVIKKHDLDAPHEIMLVLDASTGQNAISQTKLFNQAVGVTGISLTKLDGTAKGGVIFSIADQFNIPIRYIGIGEKLEDLRSFDAQDFIDALFSE